jgi:hypothetical protein
MPYLLPSVNSASNFFAAPQASAELPKYKAKKEQPWRNFYNFVDHNEGAPLVVACPKSHDFGSSGLGGVW